MSSNLLGLLSHDVTIYGNVLAHAGLNHAAGAFSSSSSGISMMCNAWKETRSGCSIFQPLHSFSQLHLMWSPKIPTAMPGQNTFQYVKLPPLIYFITFLRLGATTLAEPWSPEQPVSISLCLSSFT
jgi:hypothetical protein